MSDEPPLDEKVAQIAASLVERRVPHAFGGALALAYYAEPRATVDIDLNVFVPAERTTIVLEPLEELGIAFDRADVERRARQDGQVRVRWGRTPIDLFFSHDAFHESCAGRVREVSFGEDRIRVLGAEDLVLFKATFDRRKDWIDIEQVLFTTAGEFDIGYARRWMERLVSPDDPRRGKLEDVLEGILGA